jgi:branched-chain amino acid transport system substrate-binding protein
MTMAKIRRGWAVAAVAAVGLLAAAGCSDSKSAEADKVVAIGVISPQVAGLTDFGQGILHSVELAVAEANASGAVPGWTLKVVALDDSSNGEIGTAAAAKMVANEQVVAVVGPYNSGVSAAMLPTLEAGNLALVNGSNTLTSLTLGDSMASPKRQFSNYVRLVGADDKQGTFLAEVALARGFKKAAVVSETKAVSKDLADIFAGAFEAGGGTVAVRTVVPDAATDLSAFVAEAVAAGPDVVFIGGEYPVAAALRKQAAAAGLNVTLMGGDGIKDDALIAQAGAAAEGVLASSVGLPIAKFPKGAEFQAAYDKAGFPHPSSAYGPYAYDAANLIIGLLPGLLKEAGTPLAARSALVAALLGATYEGVTGKVAFDEFGDTKYPVFTLYVVKDGAWTVVD